MRRRTSRARAAAPGLGIDPVVIPALRAGMTLLQGNPPMNATMTLLVPKKQHSNFDEAEVLSDYRQRRALAEYERAQLKRAQIAEQHSALNCADLRIRAWEKVHGLRMPSAPRHPVLAAIAAATQLTLAEVQNEQRLRRAPRASAKV